MLENKRAETLRLLRESGKNVSGQELCEHFGISRTAVWKMMNQLKEEGYEIEAVQNKGYRLLNEPDLVTKDELESRTHTKYVGQTVYYSREVDSTNTWAKRLAEEGAPNGTLTTAETQTAGKGRRGRVWKSPEGTSVSMSILLYPDLEPAKAPMLTIVMGLAVVQGVQKALGVDTKIKWPNDAVLNGKKALWDPDRDECTDRLHQLCCHRNRNQCQSDGISGRNRGDCDLTGDRNGSFRQPGESGRSSAGGI